MLQDFNYLKMLIERFHRPLRGHNVDVIETAHALDGYKVVISPFLFTSDEHELPARIEAWVKEGGTWIVGPMSDIMTAVSYTHLAVLCGVFLYLLHEGDVLLALAHVLFGDIGAVDDGRCV